MAKRNSVELGEEFPLFEPSKTSKSAFGGNWRNHSVLPLILPNNRTTNLDIGIIRRIVPVGDFLAPFNPTLGYDISAADFDPEKRADKIVSNLNKYSREIDLGNHNLGILTISRQVQEEQKLKDMAREEPELLKTITLQLDFPNSTFESACDTEYDEDSPGDFGFHDFYPIDSGRLAIFEEVLNTKYPDFDDFFFPGIGYGGLFLALPDDINLLSSIKARFLTNWLNR